MLTALAFMGWECRQLQLQWSSYRYLATILGQVDSAASGDYFWENTLFIKGKPNLNEAIRMSGNLWLYLEMEDSVQSRQLIF